MISLMKITDILASRVLKILQYFNFISSRKRNVSTENKWISKLVPARLTGSGGLTGSTMEHIHPNVDTDTISTVYG